MRELKKFPFHVLLLAIYPILFMVAQNVGQVSLGDGVAPMLRILGPALVALLIGRLLFKGWQKAAVVVSAFLLLYFSLGHLQATLEASVPPLLLTSLALAVFLTIAVLVFRSRRSFAPITQGLNVFGVVLVLLPAASLVRYALTGSSFDLAPVHIGAAETPTDKKPDIYMIVLDAYGREDVLRELYKYDNSPFLDFLRERDFYVVDRARSNYCQTGLSVASCLNMTYLDELVRTVGEDSRSHQPIIDMIEKNSLFLFLREQGYRIVSFESGRTHTELETADVYLAAGGSINPLERTLETATQLPGVKGSANPYKKHRNIILHILENLGNVAEVQASPKFVFAHIEAPHPPFVFGRNGEEVHAERTYNDHDGDRLIRRGRLTKDAYRRYYADQLHFINQKLMVAMNEILERSAEPPVILLIGDHGPRSNLYWFDVERTDMWECMSILSAYHLPYGGNQRLNQDFSPVNAFRVVLSHYFGSDLELLEEKSYWSKAYTHFKLYDVTERVHRGVPLGSTD